MKVLALLANPRKKGNTSLLLDEYLKGIKKANNDVEITKVYLHEKNIRNCTACNVCRTVTLGKCVIKDDMQELYTQFEASALIVYATPVYWWGVSAQLKSFLDRTNAFDVPSGEYFQSKRLSILMSYEIDLPNKGPDLIKTSFEEICNYTGMILVDVYSVCANKNLPVAENSTALQAVYEMGLKIVL